MPQYWCEQAWLGDEDVADGVVLTVTGDVITDLEPGVAVAPAGSTRLDGLTLPGFANAHSHAFHRALRGRTHSGAGTFWTWREQMYELAGALDPESYEALATATFAEMVLAGYTCVGEFHYLHHGPGGVPYDDPNEMGRRLVRAASRAGIRLTLLDACYLDGGFGAALSPVQQRFSDVTEVRWIDRVADLSGTPTCRIGAAIHSVRAVAPAAMRAVAAWTGEQGMVLHAHVSEQPKENADCPAAYGASPVGLLDDGRRLERTLHRRTRHSRDDLTTSSDCRRQRHAAASARRPSATSPTASARRLRCTMPASRCPSARTPTPSSTRSRRPGRWS